MSDPLKRNKLTLEAVTPHTLMRYFELMNLSFEEAVLKDKDLTLTDRSKKLYAVTYLDDTEAREGWKALPEFKNGTWAEFKEAVFAMYPGVEKLRNGSRENLEMIFARYTGVDMDDLERLSLFFTKLRQDLVRRGGQKVRIKIRGDENELYISKYEIPKEYSKANGVLFMSC